MKIKGIVLFNAFLCITLQSQPITVTVTNDRGEPISKAQALVIYDNPLSIFRYDEQKKLSAKDGTVKFRGRGPAGASLRVEKEGYYSFGTYPAQDFRFTLKELEEGANMRVLLRKKINPVALFAKRTRVSKYGNLYIEIPAENTWVGYDFQSGDWIAPYGRGKTPDILFRYNKEFKGIHIRPYTNETVEGIRKDLEEKHERLGIEFTEEMFRLQAGKWDSVLEISFPGEKEGLVRVEDEFNPHSILMMPHQAPEDGYSPTYRYEVKSYEARKTRDDVGFFFRTRVVLDDDGKIVSANYAKVHGDFKFLAGGVISFVYYFNPRPNDRNLEFDKNQNLFPDDVPGLNNLLP